MTSTTSTLEPGAAPVLSPARRTFGLILCMLTIVLAILDQNIVSAAIVPIVRDLDPTHGVEHVSWLVAGFALAATAALPLYGRLSDVFGAKRIWLAAVTTFLVGSMLCGAAQTMGQLIAFRAVQGIGAGGLMSVTMVVMANLFAPSEGAKKGGMGGLFGGIGMAIGPLIGGLFADSGNWRWIFFVNVPLGLVIIVGGLVAIRIPRHTTGTGIDLAGATLAAAFATSLLLICEWGGKQYAWTSPVIVGLAAGAVASLVLFLRREATARNPVLPLSLFANRDIRNSYVIQLLVGVAMVSAMVYLMLYLQVARGISATGSGTFLAFMAAGLMLSGLLGGRVHTSTRTAMTSGTACGLLALGLLATTSVDTSLWTVRAELLLLGVGFGQLVGRLLIAVQVAAPRHQIGVATTGIRFFQSMGGAIGAAALGSLLNRVFEAKSGLDASRLTASGDLRTMTAFVGSVDIVFAAAAAVMAIALIFALRLRTEPAAG
jgi:EmrB/QacA subfamily drug resistance transporter